MSNDDIATQVARLNSLAERIPQLITYIRPLKESHEGLSHELRDILGENGALTELNGQVHMADKMVDDYIAWMNEIAGGVSQLSSRIASAGIFG